MSNEKKQYILISGNPVDGFNYTGPFDAASAAHDHGEDCGFAEYWIADLTTPTEEA